jgi:hypothetical protein
MPLTPHVTLAFEAPITVAWNCCVSPRKRFAWLGDIDTKMFGVGGAGEVNAPAPQPSNAREASSAKGKARARRKGFALADSTAAGNCPDGIPSWSLLRMCEES